MSTNIKGSGVLTLAAGEEVEIKAEFSTSRERHSQILIGNDSIPSLTNPEDLKLYLLGDNGKEAFPIPPLQGIIVEGDAVVKIKAAAANTGAASYTVGQIFGGKITLD